MSFGMSEIYADSVSPYWRSEIDRITEPGNWDNTRFREVLVTLVKAGPGASITARNRPETIDVKIGWIESMI